MRRKTILYKAIMSSADIPVIDFAKYGMQITDASSVDRQDVVELGKKLYEALTTVGFCYISNHGIPEQFLNEFRKSSLEFFQQPDEVKEKYKRGHFPEGTTGWIPRETESPNRERPADMREAFNYEPHGDWKGMPDSFCSNFKSYCTEFFNSSTALCMRVLEVITTGLSLPGANEIMKSHQKVGKDGNHSQIRTSYHPPISKSLKLDQARLGEHFDFGTISLHFQDDVEGLEVCNRDGIYIPAKPITGTALLFVGEPLQIWTADKLIKARHRVLAPADEKSKARAKQTIVSYLVPDNETVLKCVDGSDKYEPFGFFDNALERMDKLYEKND